MAFIPATIAQVRAVLPILTQLTDDQIQAAIDGAFCAVERISNACGKYLSGSCLTQVHIYLSAHFSAVTENTLSLSSEKDACSESSVTYGFKFGMGVNGTPFGQMANTLSGGCLAELDKRPARMFSVGCA